MSVCVRSEIGPLKKILLQRPGRELEHLVPETMSSLLFDDIPYLYRAQQEHDQFAALLRSQRVEVLYLDELMEETLHANPGLSEQFILDAVDQAGPTARGYREEVIRYLSELPSAKELIHKVMAGVTRYEIFSDHSGSLADILGDKADFVIPPMPNLYFTRDPFAIIGRGVSLHRMHTETRNREVLFGQYIFNYNIGGDLIARVPFAQWDYKRYGRDITNNNSYIAGYKVYSAKAMDYIANLLGTLTDKRINWLCEKIKEDIEKQENAMSVGVAVNLVISGILSVIALPTGGANGIEFVTLKHQIATTHQSQTYRGWITKAGKKLYYK